MNRHWPSAACVMASVGCTQQCSDRGELIQTGQRAVALPGLLREALDRFGRPARIVADRWREAELRDALDAAGVPPAALEIRGQGFKDGAEDVRGFRRAVLEGKVTPARTLLLRYAVGEARVTTDPAATRSLPNRPRAAAAPAPGTMPPPLQFWPSLPERARAPSHRCAAAAMRWLPDEPKPPAPPAHPEMAAHPPRGVRARRLALP